MPGPWDKYGTAQSAPQSGGVYTLPPNPQTERQNERQDRNDARAATNEAARLVLEQKKFEQQQREFDATHYPDGTPKQKNTQLTPEVRAKAIAQWNAAQQLDRIIADMREKYAQGPGATHGLGGIKDFFPSEANQRFDKAGSQARGIVRNALGLTGGEANTAAEANMNLGGYIPDSSNFDGTNEDIFANLQGVRDNAARQAIQTLGGVPDANGNITPVQSKTPWELPYLTMGGQKAADFGATTTTVPIPKAMQDEFNSFVASGNFTPDSYAQYRIDLDRKYGFPEADASKAGEYRKEAAAILDRLNKGGTIDLRIPGPERPMSLEERINNNLVNNPLGAAAAGVSNMMTGGAVEYGTGEQYQALRDRHPYSVMGGEMVGAALGTKGLGAGAEYATKRLAPGIAPRLLADTASARVLRNLGTDMTYSGIYGGVTQGDPVTGAVAGGIGSLAGQGAAKLGGAAIGGALETPAARYLRSQNIPLTVGQTFGGVTKALEDGATSIPIVGDIINARRLEGLRALNKAALTRAGEPVQAVTSNLGEQGANDIMGQISDAYDAATAGVRVPLDPQFGADMRAVAASAARQLPPDHAANFDVVGRNRVGPIVDAGEMTGDAYQQAMRGLKASRASAGGAAPGFEQEYRDVASEAMSALTAQMKRGGGAKVAKGLGDADIAYRRLKTLQAAQAAAKNGSASGEVQIFTPAQLNSADYASAKKFAGQRQFGDLADAAQSALPSKIPDSGTGRRIIQNVVGGSLIGGGATAYGMGTGDTDSLKKAAAAAALLSLGGTRMGQKAITAALTGRPKAAQQLGELLRKQQRIAGAAAVPLSVQSTR